MRRGKAGRRLGREVCVSAGGPGGEEEEGEPRAGRLPASFRCAGPRDSYVQVMVQLHYKTDEAVRDDSELQSWCREITEVGLRGAQDRGKISPRPPGPFIRDSSPGNLSRILSNFCAIFQKHFQPYENAQRPSQIPCLAARHRAPSYALRELL